MFNFNREYYLIRNPNGVSHLGGDISEGFSIPQNKCPGSFQYLGYLNNQDRGFRFLESGIHLICPIYMNIDKVWLDYSDAMNPIIINLDEINSLDTEYEDLNDNSIISFEKTPFITTPIKTDSNYRLGRTGKPDWIQHKEVPVCPMTNNKMRFLCQLEYQFQEPIKTKYTNVKPEDLHYKEYFDEMNFWGSGDLYVFFEPKSKTACYFIQNT